MTGDQAEPQDAAATLHDWQPVGYCSHPHARGANEHRVYRCTKDGHDHYAHSRSPVGFACGRRPIPREKWPPVRCPVSMQQSEVEAWHAWMAERTAALEDALAEAQRQREARQAAGGMR